MTLFLALLACGQSPPATPAAVVPAPLVLPAPLVAVPDDPAVARVLIERIDVARRCQDVIDDLIPDIHGTARIAFTVAAGKAAAIEVVADDSFDGHLGRCTAGRLRELAFPPEASGRFEATWRWERSGG